jgi:hypothetical protein
MVMGDAETEAEIAHEKQDERVYSGQAYLNLSHMVIQKKNISDPLSSRCCFFLLLTML